MAGICSLTEPVCVCPPAGSERVHGGEHGGSQATGKHFKEACHINKSLTTLGRVITELVEAQRTGPARGGNSVSKGIPANRNRHVPYRDSRLTFLLQDSLGGNAKTLMIANISPCSVSGAETLSTLQFMSRAKCIRNRAKINLDAQGDVGELQREIARLNVELDNLRKGYTEPAIQEAKQLREELSK
jgi:kinesin family protein 15